MPKISEVVTDIQGDAGLSDFQMSKALRINQSTLHRLKIGVFDSEAQILQEIQNKMDVYFKTTGRGK